MGNQKNNSPLETATLRTPAFVIDVEELKRNAQSARTLVCDGQTRLLFALKSFSTVAGLESLAPHVDGFAASSLNEVQLARKILIGQQQTIHVTTPGLRSDEIPQYCRLADYISFNSIPQWQRFKDIIKGQLKCGLRVNPQLSFVDDPRYDPCRQHSKLGVPLAELRRLLQEQPEELDGISGLHFHSHCDATDLAPLLTTVKHLLNELAPLFDQITWLNLGGGYLLNEASNKDVLSELKGILAKQGNYQLFMEPGAAIARSAGSLVATVVDLFNNERKQIAVLDTSINHLPEVFEYQLRPEVINESTKGKYSYLLAGSACLAGDIFGEYRFAAPLEVGSRIVFPNRGVYSLVKANMFNGINLPTIYLLNERGVTEEVKRFGFTDFMSLCGEREPCCELT